MEKISQFSDRKPLPPNLPHLAYVLLWFPLFTQPFIFREVEGLRKVLPIEVYSLYGKNDRFWSEEMRRSDIRVTRYGLWTVGRIVWSTIKAFWRSPRVMWKLFRQSCMQRWQGLEILGENLWAFFAGANLAERFREDGIDMIYAPWPRGSATAARVAATLNDLPFVVAARGDNLDPADADLEDKFADALLIRANNAADQERIENFGSKSAKNKTCLVYNSLTLPSATKPDLVQGKTDNEVRLLAVGRFDVTKGFDILLRACAILRKSGLPFRLTLAGGGGKVMGLGNMEKYLRQLLKELGLENNVSMPGLVSHDELPGLLEGHDIFVAPCIVHSSGRRDGIPNTIIEAMAYGLPVVGSDINALPEVIRHEKTGLLVAPSSPEELAEAIKRLAASPAFAAELGKNAAHLAQELFDCEVNSRKLAACLELAWKKWLSDKASHG